MRGKEASSRVGAGSYYSTRQDFAGDGDILLQVQGRARAFGGTRTYRRYKSSRLCSRPSGREAAPQPIAPGWAKTLILAAAPASIKSKTVLKIKVQNYPNLSKVKSLARPTRGNQPMRG